MINYSKMNRSRFSAARLVLLLIMILALALSGCGDNEEATTSSISGTISGTITSGGAPLSGVTVTLTGNSSMVMTTDKNGNYSFTDLSSGTYRITPSLAGFAFNPINRNFVIGHNATGFNFTGIVLTGSVLSSVAATLHTVYLKNDGTVWTWGSNSNGQLGNGTTTNSSTPVQVSRLSGMTMTAIAAGNNFTVALKNDDTVWAWGSNTDGQLGNGTTTDSHIPVQASAVSGLSSVIGIAAGSIHTVALKIDGTMWAWGGNINGQLGNGTTTKSNIAVQVSGLSSVIGIAAGYNHTVALKNDGTVWAWGSNSNGQIGNGTTTDSFTPVQVSRLSGMTMTAIAAGNNFTVAIRNDGTVWAWGSNTYGQLGNGTTTDSFTPVQVSRLSGMTMKAIAAGNNFTVAIRNDGTVWAWGSNTYGQLGNGTTIDSFTPVQASGLSGMTMKAIAAGNNFTVALKNNDTVWAWGSNSNGQIGDGTTTSRLTPEQIL